jgi:prepilin-type N-terminal cleavage/methylation domain-containing protein
MKISQNGFSLVELMITLGLTAAAVVAVTQIQSQGMKTNKTIETGGLANDLSNEVRMILSNTQSCGVNLSIPGNFSGTSGDLKFDSANSAASLQVGKITFGDALQTPKIVPGSSIGNGNATKVRSINVKSLQAMTADLTSFKGDLQIALDTAGKVYGGKDKILHIPIFFRTEVAGGSVVEIKGCSVAANEDTNPVVSCGYKGKFFLPTGFKGNAADANGCVDATAFVGPSGPQGPAGDGGGGGGSGRGPSSESPSDQVVGGGSCVLYTTPACADWGCGPGPGCPSTWTYWGAGQDGGCSTGSQKDTSMSSGGTTGFICVK